MKRPSGFISTFLDLQQSGTAAFNTELNVTRSLLNLLGENYVTLRFKGKTLVVIVRKR